MSQFPNTSTKEQGKDTDFKDSLYHAVVEEMESTAGEPLAVGDEHKPGRKRSPGKDDLLADMLSREELLSDAATKEVVFSPPLIKRAEMGIIGRGTINVIQGAYGSHKSRLAELMSSLMLSTPMANPTDFLGFERAQLERFCVCYIDTERNQGEELPFAIQGIKRKAGYALTDRPADFRFTSIKAIARKDRFAAIEAFIEHVRSQTALHLFVLIDVVTDAIGDFNDAKESMALYDFIGNLCDQHNATFLLVIHQNPGTDKARGHTGTEAANKASSVLQIGFEKDGNGNESELIKLRYLKLRRGKRPEPIYLQYSDACNGLIVAGEESLANHLMLRKQKADMDAMIQRLESLLSEGPAPKGEVVEQLMNEFTASNRTIRDRLKNIAELLPEMYDDEGRAVRLVGYKQGRNDYYRLEPIGPADGGKLAV
ncbi:AAA family ATPase [Spirosoma sp. SC4-14]|uniref:AAA family ATPase n=1 Tax=Spirosoma sp. SC4-14 TaxID=3128900 RepID=UPI0030D3313D